MDAGLDSISGPDSDKIVTFFKGMAVVMLNTCTIYFRMFSCTEIHDLYVVRGGSVDICRHTERVVVKYQWGHDALRDEDSSLGG